MFQTLNNNTINKVLKSTFFMPVCDILLFWEERMTMGKEKKILKDAHPYIY